MDDEELRSELTAMTLPPDRIPVPDVSVLTRRLRRRRGGQATAGMLALTIAAAGLGVGLSRAPAGPGSQSPSGAGTWASRDLRATWLKPAVVRNSRLWTGAPPVTYPL